jgi:hypothetical protein
VATFVAVVAARVLSANRPVRNQAAAAAILTVDNAAAMKLLGYTTMR